MQQPLKIRVRTISAGGHGDLSVIQSSTDLPFPIRRVYYLHGLRDGARRGFHAHKDLYQAFTVVHGRCRLTLEGPAGHFAYELDRADEMVLIPPGYWREMHELDSRTVIMVLASADYEENDYIRDYDEFKTWLARRTETDRTPYLDLTRYDRLLGKTMEEAVSRVFQSGRYINGPRVEQFERQFAGYCGTARAVGVGNGLDALTLILMALGIGPGDEVIVCAAGFAATALAPVRVGARPVFVDCLAGGHLNPELAAAAVSPATRAIIPTHLYGLPEDWAALEQVARGHDLPLIEDACQAHGARWRGRLCGSLGRAAAFSFYPTKNLGAVGDGGCVVTDDERLADQVRLLANYGARTRRQHQVPGLNSRLDELQAAILLTKLPFLDEWNESRRRLVSVYRETLAGLDGRRLELPKPRLHDRPSWHVYAVRVKDGLRDALADHLRRRGVETNIHYPTALPGQPCFQSRPEAGRSYPQAEAWAAETLSLPLDALHRPEELHHVCRAIGEFYGDL